MDSLLSDMGIVRGMRKETAPIFEKLKRDMDFVNLSLASHDDGLEHLTVGVNAITAKQANLQVQLNETKAANQNFAVEVDEQLDKLYAIVNTLTTAAAASAPAVAAAPVTPVAKAVSQVAPIRQRRRPRDDDFEYESGMEEEEETDCSCRERNAKRNTHDMKVLMDRFTAMEKKVVSLDAKNAALQKTVNGLKKMVAASNAMSTGAVFSTSQSAAAVLSPLPAIPPPPPPPSPVAQTTATTIRLAKVFPCLYCSNRYSQYGDLTLHLTHEHTGVSLIDFGKESASASASSLVAIDLFPDLDLSLSLSPVIRSPLSLSLDDY